MRTVAVGRQNFSAMIENHCFYIDKTDFIREWWDSCDDVTLITRPRRFGKTLTMSMTEQFFSPEYAKRNELFENLSIWKEEKYRRLQGTYPVIFLSFAKAKGTSFETVRKMICYEIVRVFLQNRFLLEGDLLAPQEKDFFARVSAVMDDADASESVSQLCRYLYYYYGKKTIILLDEYDTPMHEAYVNGYWKEMSDFIRGFFHAAFKTNPYLERAIMTGITRVSRESVFSDLNNLQVVPVTSSMYHTVFGFTEDEVKSALTEYGMQDKMPEVKQWYDGFQFGNSHNIYNPWSITKFLKEKKFTTYWANTSSNALIGKLIREGSFEMKTAVEDLLQGKTYQTAADTEIVFSDLDDRESAIWGLLLAGGYVKAVEEVVADSDMGDEGLEYKLALTNKEIVLLFRKMVHGWFSDKECGYRSFLKALLEGDLKGMNEFMNRVALATVSMFDTGNRPSEQAEPERFYHGFVLGLIVDLRKRYVVTSNRESGFGRYDVLMKPLSDKDDAVIMEFKVSDPEHEKNLSDTAKAALWQVLDRRYAAGMEAEGMPKEKIRIYGFAFRGKKVLIDGGYLKDFMPLG